MSPETWLSTRKSRNRVGPLGHQGSCSLWLLEEAWPKSVGPAAWALVFVAFSLGSGILAPVRRNAVDGDKAFP